MRASSFLPVLLSFALVGCEAGSIDVQPPDRSGPDAGQQNPAADADPGGGGPLAARVQGADLLYHFAGGTAGQTVIGDLSGQTPPIDLAIADPLAITWGLSTATITAPTILTNPQPATRVRDKCAQAGSFTVEAWVRTGDIGQNGTIASLQENTGNISIKTRQEGDTYYTYRRTTATPTTGDPAVVAGLVDAVNLQHYVYTRAVTNGTQAVYINGTALDPAPLAQVGATGIWPNLSYFAIGAEAGEIDLTNPWVGEIALVAVYCRDLSPAEVSQNYAAGY